MYVKNFPLDLQIFMLILYDAVASGFIARETVQLDNLTLANQAFGMLFNFPTVQQSLKIVFLLRGYCRRCY